MEKNVEKEIKVKMIRVLVNGIGKHTRDHERGVVAGTALITVEHNGDGYAIYDWPKEMHHLTIEEVFLYIL
jgi:hypothetical protein